MPASAPSQKRVEAAHHRQATTSPSLPVRSCRRRVPKQRIGRPGPDHLPSSRRIPTQGVLGRVLVETLRRRSRCPLSSALRTSLLPLRTSQNSQEATFTNNLPPRLPAHTKPPDRVTGRRHGLASATGRTFVSGKPTVGLGRGQERPASPSRHIGGRCGRLFAPDGSGRDGYAGRAQDPEARADRPPDGDLRRALRQADGRRHAGGVPERGRRARLRDRRPGGGGQTQRRRFPTIGGSRSGSASTSAT